MACFSFGEARELRAPGPFRPTATTDKLYDEMQAVKPLDPPPLDLTAGAKAFKVTDLFPLPGGPGVDLVGRYPCAHGSHSGEKFPGKLAGMQAVRGKYREWCGG